MTAIKSQDWWFNQPVFHESESNVFEVPANYSQGYRAVGGKLFGSTQRLIFVPNRIDAKLGGRVVSIPRDQITNVSKVARSWSVFEIFSGALVPRMSVMLHDGTRFLFVVNSIDENITLLLSYLSKNDDSTE